MAEHLIKATSAAGFDPARGIPHGWGFVYHYQPCYRSEAGTGNAMGFLAWERACGR